VPIYALDERLIFPDPEEAEDESGLLAVGGDLSPHRLLLAYSMGIFPWPVPGIPLAWFSPPERMVLPPSELHVSRRLRGYLNQSELEVTLDRDFESVIDRCAETGRRRERSTWITRAMRDAYVELHELGFAHSVESWRDGVLVGGLYGVAVGAAFSGESMFYDEPNASKVAFVRLVRQLQRWDFDFVDCQMHTPHVAALGAREWTRERFLEALSVAVRAPQRRGRWSFDSAH